jgi:ASPM-SPD-2-Hydin domain-containing protein/HYDIN/CFA65/VesB family protein/centrosomal CEP192-like protein/Ig-like domain-containing protein/Big-like domain-containing protein
MGYPKLTRLHTRIISICRSIFLLLMTAVLAALTLSGCAYSASSSGNLAVSPTSLSFGNVVIGSSSNQTLTLTNSGSANFTLTQTVASGGDFTIKGPPLPLTLPQGQSATFTTSFAPTAISIVSGSLSVTTSESTSPRASTASVPMAPIVTTQTATITMTGAGVQAAPSITTQPASQTVTSGQTATFSVTSSGAAPLSYQWLKNGTAISGAISQTYTTPTTTVSDNASQFTVVVTNSAGGVTSSTATLTVNGATLALQASSTAMSFGNVTLSTSSSQNVTLTNAGNSNITISNVSVSGAGFSASGVSTGLILTLGQTATLSTTFNPSSAGSVTGSVTVSSNASPVLLSLSGTGIQPSSPQISVTPGNPTFGSVMVGSSGTQSVTVSNTGNASLSISAANLTGSGFTISGLVLPLNLSPGQSSSFSVTFAPTAARSVTGTLSLVSNASSSPTQVGLTGSAVQPPSPSVTGVTISPTNPRVQAGQTIQFNDTVEGTTTNTSVTWTASAGTIAAGGLFTPPISAGTVTVTATSNADNSKQASTAVTVTAPPLPPTQQFYVSPTGNDSDSGTSTSTPWQTIQKAMNSATAGSTVNIMAGIYQEELTMNVSGTSGNYITFQPYDFSVPAGGCAGYTGVACGGDQVILDYSYLGTNTSQTPLFEIGGKSYIRVQGLTFQNFACFGPLQWGVRIENGASYIEFDYNKFLNLKNTGPFDGTAWLSPIRIGTGSAANNITFIGNELGNLVTLYSEALTFDGSSVISGLVQDNYIHDTDGNGVTTYNGANNIAFRHNKLEYIAIRRDGTVWYNMLRVAIYIDGGYSDVIERNFVNGAGVGIEALSEPGQVNTHDVTIRNNVVENCNAPGASGIVIGTWYSETDGSSVYNINVWNNTFYANTDGVVIRPMVSSTVAWENNIFANNGTTYINSLNWNPGTVGYNVYFGGGSGPGSNNLTLDPLFVSASTGNFSLQSISPAINADDPLSSTTIVGTVDFVGNPRVLGGRIDIGAYEVQ